MNKNEYNQPIGDEIKNYTFGEYPNIEQINGFYCSLEKLSLKKHYADLVLIYGENTPKEQWTYLPFEALPENKMAEFFQQLEQSVDPYYFCIVDKKNNAVVGTFALMRIDPKNRTIEMGAVIYSPQLKRSTIATEAQYLMMKYVFETLNYRRYEWKCDALNEPSIRSAKRLGFQLEGIFRNAMVYKGRNRDTAWFSILPEEWLKMKPKFELWLNVNNFDELGQQLKPLNKC